MNDRVSCNANLNLQLNTSTSTRTTDTFIHLPRSLFWGFPLLLKKLRLLHDIHLLIFMTEKYFYKRKREKEGERNKNRSGTGRQGDGGGWVRETKRKRERGSAVEVREHLSSTLGLFVWGAGPGCQMWHHTHVNAHTNALTHTHSRQEDEKSEWQEQGVLQLVN